MYMYYKHCTKCLFMLVSVCTLPHVHGIVFSRKPAEVVPKATVTSSTALPSSSVNLAADGLARVGARAALSFAFAFLRRAWRSGDDSELCEQVIFNDDCIITFILILQS